MYKKGQISTEYLIVVGFVVFLILGIVGVAFFYTSITSDQIRVSQVSNLMEKIISSSESVFYSGEPSKLTLSGYLPIGVNNIEIRANEIIVNMSMSSGVAVMSFSSNVPISGSISSNSGGKRLAVIARQSDVSISEF